MKKIIALLVIFGLIFGILLLKGKKKEDYLVKINDYTITMQKFEKDFKDSAYATNDTPESRSEFLNGLIKRKLILQDAQTKGLDKDKEFLMMIERFWEQSLLQRAINEKNKEISSSVNVSDKAIEDEYKKLQREGKADKPYGQMYSQIKWSLKRAEESKAMQSWIAELYKNANIKMSSPYSVTNNLKGVTESNDEK